MSDSTIDNKLKSSRKEDISGVALTMGAKLLNSESVRTLPREAVEAIYIIAFTYGAAWALGEKDMIAFADAQIASMRSVKQ